MNVNFGDDNFYVRYLKRFLNHELQENNAVLGQFTTDDLDMLVKYLNLPNVKDMFEVKDEIEETFPILATSFNALLQNDSIKFTSKQIPEEVSEWIMDNLDDIKDYCESVGWELTDVYEYVDTSKDINGDGLITSADKTILNNIVNGSTDYDDTILAKADLNLDGNIDNDDLVLLSEYLESGKLYITIEKTDRKNYFPNSDMLVFINQFKGLFLYNYAIRDDIGIDDIPHTNSSEMYKIALYECTPGQKVTIAHNNTVSTRLVIGGSPATLKKNIPSFELQNVVDITLAPGEGYQYTCASVADGTGYDVYWLCIQVPSDYSNLDGSGTTTLTLDAGDINFDGVIDMQDYYLLANYTATGPGSEELHWTPTAKQLAVMNVDETHSGIDVYDAIKLYKFIQGDSSITSLGVAYYTYESGEESDLDNVSNLLIIDGHYDDDINIPFSDFTTDPWVVHEKFFNYLLGMAIHKYSDSENITYLQKLIKAYYPSYVYESTKFYPGYYSDKMKEYMKAYQTSWVNYTTGDLNKDNELTSADLTMLRNYLDDENVIAYNKVYSYLQGELELTDAEIAALDITSDGKLTSSDLSAYKELIDDTYTATFLARADANGDNTIDENDYILLEKEVNGTSNTLKHYEIPFMLGWCDVESEKKLELEYNIDGTISEVSK